MANLKIPTKLDVSLYGKIEQISPTLSQCRVRIFYKGMNRNRTYISEDFANQLIASLPYAPIKGIFDADEDDFEDHGRNNTDGRVYGVVKENPNFAWEEHRDADGIVRTYACADVILLTGLYPEANEIEGKSQSMEIYKNNLEGEWKIAEDGEPYYFFKKGCLVGLQVLGDEVEPCFEGAAFYFNLYKDLQEITSYLKSIQKEGEVKKMENTLFRLSDSEKAEQLCALLNPNFTEEGNWQYDACLCDVYEDYALFYDVNAHQYKRAYYSKDGDSIALGDIVDVYIVDVSKEEQMALEAIKATSGSFTAAQEAFASMETEKQNFAVEKQTLEEKVSALEEEKTAFEAQLTEKDTAIAQKDESIATYEAKVNELETEKSTFSAEKLELEQKISDITTENEILTEFKKTVETEKKQEILDKYSEHIAEDVYTELRDKIDTFSIEDFKKEVCTAAVESDGIFAKAETTPRLIYTGSSDAEPQRAARGIERILDKYKKGGN